MNPDKTTIDATEKAKKIVRKFPQIEQAVLAPMLTLEIARALLSEAEGERWISVDERLPEHGGQVLIAFDLNEHNKGLVTTARHEKGHWDWNSSIANRERRDSDVTHWQPLPAPPKVTP